MSTELQTIQANALILNEQFMTSMYKLAELMANSNVTVPQHLRGNTADCMAIVLQSAQWGMNPFAVAQKTHLVSGILGYEAQLVNAVISSSKLIVGRFKYEWFGPWENVIGKFVEKTSTKGNKYLAPNWTLKDEKGCGVRVIATIRGDDAPTVFELLLSQATVRNSTLWASDPKQQLAYLAVKRWSRLYTPDVIMGVYTTDELEPVEPTERDITPKPAQPDQAEKSEKSSTLERILNRKSGPAQQPAQASQEPAPAQVAEFVDREHDPFLVADKACQDMEAAAKQGNTDAMNDAYRTGWNGLNELGNYWSKQKNGEQIARCKDFKETVQQVYHDLVQPNTQQPEEGA